MLKSRGKSRSYTTGGKTYTYSEYEIASKSYNPEKEYQPIFATTTTICNICITVFSIPTRMRKIPPTGKAVGFPPRSMPSVE